MSRMLLAMEAHTRRTRRAVLGAQIFTSAGMAAAGTAGGLLAAEVTGRPGASALPLGMLVVGTGVGAPVATRLMSRRGRRSGLTAMYLAAAVGAALVVLGARAGAFTLLLAGNFLMGGGNAAMMLTRFVLADLGPAHRRGESIGISLAALSIGAVLGPVLLAPSSRVAASLGLPPASGLYLLAASSLVIGPLLLRRDHAGAGRRPAAPRVGGRVRISPLAVALLGTANLTMVAIMATLPVHLAGAGHGLHRIGWVIGLHVAAMYVASPLIGRAADRMGARPVAVAGALLHVVVAGTATAGLHGPAVTLLAVALGLGWSAHVVAGSALIVANVAPHLRPRAEAAGEMAMSIGAALGTLVLAGPLVSIGGEALLSVACVALNVVVTLALFAGSPAQPSGPRTLALLFTDIESSTELAFLLGTKYAAVLQRHRHLIRAAVACHAGTIVGFEGDSVLAVFDSPRDAVAAARAAQQALGSEPWPTRLPVRVRMGIHLGEALVRDGEVIGYAVHCAARVTAIARGGQIVLSDDAARHLPLEPVRDLGEHRLKGLDRTVRLHEVAV